VYAPPLLLAPDAARCAPNSSRVARTFPTSAQSNHLGSVQVERLCPTGQRHVYSQIKLAASGWLNVRFSADCDRTADTSWQVQEGPEADLIIGQRLPRAPVNEHLLGVVTK